MRRWLRRNPPEGAAGELLDTITAMAPEPLAAWIAARRAVLLEAVRHAISEAIIEAWPVRQWNRTWHYNNQKFRLGEWARRAQEYDISRLTGPESSWAVTAAFLRSAPAPAPAAAPAPAPAAPEAPAAPAAAPTTELITGNTYMHREALKAMGGRWDASAQGWRVPAHRASDARALVSRTTPSMSSRTTSSRTTTSTKSKPKRRGTWTGCSCGSVEEFAKASDCWSCRHDR